MCWIDYQKAYDMVPHSWIGETLRAYGVAKNIISFVTRSMETWNVWLYHQREVICNIPIRRGIFQGDSLSPLLFIIALFPLSHALLNNNELGYQRTNSRDFPVSHLLYMDDIKLFAKSKPQMERLISIVKNFSDQMGMKFGIEKCKLVHIHRGKLSTDGEQ